MTCNVSYYGPIDPSFDYRYHIINTLRKALIARGRHKKLVEVKSVFCFFAVTELGVKLADLALRFSVTGPAIGVAVRRGRDIAERKGLKLA